MKRIGRLLPLTILEGRWVSLAVDRVGHHMVKKIFAALPQITDKAMLVKELASSGSNRLSGTSMGRDIMEACAMNEYERDKKAWRHTVSKMLSSDGEKWIENELPSKDNKKLKEAPSEQDKKSKCKRKQKKIEKASPDNMSKPSKKKLSSVGSIMKLMTAPNDSLRL